jgi:transcriptional regulator with XRE-family HTH domain
VSADLKQGTISRLENSGRRPHPKTLMKLAYALGVVPEKLDPDLADAYQPRPTRQMPEKVAKPLLVLVGALARKYARWNGERTDLSSAGQEGLWEAWSKFDPDRASPSRSSRARGSSGASWTRYGSFTGTPRSTAPPPRHRG